MMLVEVQKFFQKHIMSAEEGSFQAESDRLHLATATLLFEMARMDDHIDDREREAIGDLLSQRFSLDEDMSAELLAMAADTAHNAVCMQEYTRLLNEHFSQQQKVQMVRMLWEVAISDGIIDKYEDLFVRQVADLLYVPHRDFIRTRHDVCE